MVRSEARVDPIASPHVDTNKYQGDEGALYEAGADHGGVVLHQQWVTLTAGMWPPESTTPTATPTRGWRISSERLPLLAAVFCGAALVACLLGGFLFYKCWVMPRRDKHFCLRKIEPAPVGTSAPPRVAAPPHHPSQSAVFAERRGCGGWGYSSRLVRQPPHGSEHQLGRASPWHTARPMMGGPQCTHCPSACAVPRSSSSPPATYSSIQVQSNQPSTRKQRPVSQPISSDINGEIVPKSPLPEISEFSPNSTQYASSSILDEVGSRDGRSSEESTMKTRSLPACVRSKPRPLSTEDDINDLYAKVNFSKKRKNRMRNDEAAIIALSKSRSQFLHKDTDSLVDNEAVIVYDERTAL